MTLLSIYESMTYEVKGCAVRIERFVSSHDINKVVFERDNIVLDSGHLAILCLLMKEGRLPEMAEHGSEKGDERDG